MSTRKNNRMRELLHGVFNVPSLREGQRQVIDSVLAGRDTLAVMPTGSGKSLCYQVPACLLPGVTVVVSPLIALMKDQVEKLQEAGIDSAAQVNSSLSRGDELAALDGIRKRLTDIIFCTPERLVAPDFLALLRQSDVSLVVIDEAHCISQWGHDFRPAYLEVGAAIAALGHPPLLALTATATEDVIDDIRRQLGSPRMALINTGIYRPNLHYRVRQVTNPDEQVAAALQLVRDTPGVGIVYAATIKAAEDIYRRLRDAGESVALYHGKLRAADRVENQDLFMCGERRVMVATNAFGMGIDKSDTRFVIHLQVPATLDAYYQESGRAGRDGEPAECTLLYLHADKRLQQFFLMKHYPSVEDLQAVATKAGELARRQPAFTQAEIKPLLDMPDSQLTICLKLLKDGKLLRRNRKLAYTLGALEATRQRLAQLAHIYIDKQERDRKALEQMVGYAQSGYCRWKLLLDYFGDLTPDFERCCQCDNCLAPPMPAGVAQQELYAMADGDDAERLGARESAHGTAPAPASADAPARDSVIAIGSQVRVPRFDIGTVLQVAGDKITIEFPENSTKTFMAEFVEPL